MAKTKVARKEIINERGRRIGESHPRAKLTDHEVDLIRELYEELRGKPAFEIAHVIAKKFDVHECTVRKIVRAR